MVRSLTKRRIVLTQIEQVTDVRVMADKRMASRGMVV